MLETGRRKESPWPKTSTQNNLRTYLLEPKYISKLVVKGQGDSPARYTRTEARDLRKAARVHYFTTKPSNKFVEMKLDIKKRMRHEERVFHPEKKIDNAAPRLYPHIPRTERAAYRLDDIMLQNKKLLERICTIWRTKGKVDTSPPNVQYKSSFRQRMWDMVRIEADNVALLYFIQKALPRVPTRDECAKDFKIAVDKMKFISNYPLLFIKDPSRDAPLPMENPPEDDPDAPPRKRAFMEFITSEDRFLGRIEFELFEEEAPQAVSNFLAHIRGEVPKPEEEERGADQVADGPRTYSYRDVPIHRILPGYYCLGGDVVNHNGSGGSSIHGEGPFPDEKNDLIHNEPGLLCTIGAKPDSNDSKFMITMKPLPTLDGKSTVFGRIVKGFDVLGAINALGAKGSGKPLVQVYCCNCGEIPRAPRRKRRSPRSPRGAAGKPRRTGSFGSGDNKAAKPGRTTTTTPTTTPRRRKSSFSDAAAAGGSSEERSKPSRSPYLTKQRSPYSTPRRSPYTSPRNPRF